MLIKIISTEKRYSLYKTQWLWIEIPIFLQNESIRIDSWFESNRIDSNRESECSSGITKFHCAMRTTF